MFPINFNFPYRKKDGSLITMEKALDGAGADLDLIDLDDVAITSPADGDGLIYDNTAKKWKNIPIISRIVALFNAWKKNGAYNLACGVFTGKVESGSTWVANPDGSVSVSGESAGSNITSSAFTLKAGTYLVGYNPIPQSGEVTTDATNLTILDSSNNHLPGLPLNDATSKVITVAADTVVKIRLYAYANSSGHTTNTTFYPVITTDLNATVADFVPPAKTNLELTEESYVHNNTLAYNVDLSAYSSSSNTYIVPYDGYIQAATNSTGGKMSVVLCNGTITQDVLENTSAAIPVKKGINVYATGNKRVFYFRAPK